MLAPALLACLLCLISRAAVNAQSTEPYRIRIANTLYGPVDISTDKGQTWTMVARVQRAATIPSDGGTAAAPSVERANKDGIAFGVGSRRLVRILPDLPASYKNPSAIVVSMLPALGLFREMLPPLGSAVTQFIGKHEAPLAADYVPHEGDVLIIGCPISSLPAEKIAEQIKLMVDRYKESVAARLRTQGKKPTNGILTVTVNVPAGEKVGALTYFVDGEVVAIQNTAPFVVKLDTRKWANGEHLLEARAVDGGGAVVTQKKTLLFVENAP